MSIQITGDLVDPSSTGIEGATIRFVATTTDADGAVEGTYIEQVTGTGGTYDFPTVLPGTYRVDVTHGGSKDKFITLGNCTILNTDTGAKTLQGLGIS